MNHKETKEKEDSGGRKGDFYPSGQMGDAELPVTLQRPPIQDDKDPLPDRRSVSLRFPKVATSSSYPSMPQQTPTSANRMHSSMIRPERNLQRTPSGRSLRNSTLLAESDKTKFSAWRCFSWTVTFWAFPWCLKRCGKTLPEVQQAWREKIALCFIISVMCGALGFLTYGFTTVVCGSNIETFGHDVVKGYTNNLFPNRFIIHGSLYDLKNFLPWHSNLPGFRNGIYPSAVLNASTAVDISAFFPNVGPSCQTAIEKSLTFTCSNPEFRTMPHCHDYNSATRALGKQRLGFVTYSWNDVNADNSNLIVFKNRVLNMTSYLRDKNAFLGTTVNNIILANMGRDMTLALGSYGSLRNAGECLIELYTVGLIETRTIGCIATDIVLYISLIIILSLVLVRFALAVVFKWFISRELGKLSKARDQAASPKHPFEEKEKEKEESPEAQMEFPTSQQQHLDPEASKGTSETPKTAKRIQFPYIDPRTSTQNTPTGSPRSERKFNDAASPSGHQKGERKALTVQISSVVQHHAQLDTPSSKISSIVDYMDTIHTVMLVTCYSEGSEGLRITFDSLASTTYNEKNKLLFIIADGLITGSGNEKSTPELILDMLELDSHWPKDPEPQSYLAIASGSKRHNKAKVYVAWYNHGSARIPTILVVKCGASEEQSQPKPGNRGKRDSQIILMNFFKKVMFDEHMSPLEYDLFRKVHFVSGVTPDFFEIVLMVDADTKVAPDSLSRMVAAMARDPLVMGLCGETRIANKAESWVSRIQVFEYYLSHHLNKAFESIFGGVTCLPGCFCMYRIKTPKETPMGTRWVPILANPDIVATYSENVVDTLHKKNLLLLGEDRFLTTLMLREFPNRKLIFVPSAFCKTVVPAEFKVLLSQRRRWINSTIHNLLELVLVNELCGVFCFSMQFVIFIDLIGTVVLPAAIAFTIALIIISIVGPVQVIPLLLLGAILGLPAILVLLTTRRVIYVYWMLVYLLALPIWNFVLPVYAFWHFDDFSWGQTRMVEGEVKDTGHGGSDGKKMDARAVPLRQWAEWEKERRKAVEAAKSRKKKGKKTLSKANSIENFAAPSEAENEGPSSHRAP
ncbi:Chitin synthase, class 3 [Dinochytrium kinnereticum]|nr:Chitin synthase, class 3 [Dinochytrium kinnereticum]